MNNARLMYMMLGTLISANLLLAGCASTPPMVAPLAEMRWIPTARDPHRTPRPLVAVSLGAGAMRGFAHIGVMRAFERAGIVPDIIVGSSIGAIIGSLWAAGLPSSKVESISDELSSKVFTDFAPSFWQVLTGRFKGFAGGIRIEEFIIRHLGERTIEQLPIRFAVVAADLNSGEAVSINAGPLATAVRASSALPVALTPIEVAIKGVRRELTDGGLVEPVPVRTAHKMGADIVVAVDIGYRPKEANVRTVVDVLFQSMQIAINALRYEQLKTADLVIEPMLTEHDISRENAVQMIAEGERAAQAAIAELRKRMSR